MKTCFSEGKLIKQFGTPPPFLRESPLSSNLSISEQFFHRGWRKLCKEIKIKKNIKKIPA